MSALQVTRDLDGTTVQWATPGEMRRALLSWAAVMAVAYAVFPIGALAIAVSTGPSLHLSVLGLGLAVSVAGLSPQLVRPIRHKLRHHFAYRLVFRGQNLIQHSAIGTHRQPLAEVIAVDAKRQALITADFRYTPLAPMADPVVRQELVRFLHQHLAQRTDSSAADIPAEIKALQQDRQPQP